MDAIVFLGPTLPLTEAQKIFPEAHYHAPAKCGDILRVLRLKPKKIVLIDGYFERTTSVWHKEILFALEKGVSVYGASSMGALRAAELADFGMRGVGKVFQDYRSSYLDNDDAVAVLHADRDTGYAQMNEALVDIQASLEKAHGEKVISQSKKETLLHEITSWFYPDRCLEHVYKKAEENGSPFQEFSAWLQQYGIVKQKALDAIEVLHVARREKPPDKGFPEVPKTYYFRILIRNTNCSAFPEKYDWLPQEEQALVLEEREDPKFFNALRELAFILLVSYDLARSHPSEDKAWDSHSGDAWEKALKNVLLSCQSDGWLETIYCWAFKQAMESPAKDQEMARYFTCFVHFFGYNLKTIAQGNLQSLIFQYALLFFAIDRFLQKGPHIFEWNQSTNVKSLTKKYHQVERITRTVRALKRPKADRDDLVSKIARFHYMFQGSAYNNAAPIQDLDPKNWILRAKQAIHREDYFKPFFKNLGLESLGRE